MNALLAIVFFDKVDLIGIRHSNYLLEFSVNYFERRIQFLKKDKLKILLFLRLTQ